MPTGQDDDKKPPKTTNSADESICQLCGQTLTPEKSEEYKQYNRRSSDKK